VKEGNTSIRDLKHATSLKVLGFFIESCMGKKKQFLLSCYKEEVEIHGHNIMFLIMPFTESGNNIFTRMLYKYRRQHFVLKRIIRKQWSSTQLVGVQCGQTI